jgi:hypothetical protein
MASAFLSADDPMWLPPEVMLLIFSQLPSSSLCSAAQVDKYWNDLSGAGFLWRNRYKSDFFPTNVPVNPPPLEQVGTGSSATLFSDFDEVLRKWITKDAEWKAYYRERVNHNRSFRLDPLHVGPDVRLDDDGCVVMLEKDQSDGQSIVLSTVELKPGYLYFWEMVVEHGFAGIMLGVANPTVPLATQLGSDSTGWAFTGDNSGWTFHAGRWTNFPAFAPGDRVGVRLFLKSESESEMACYKNGQFLGVAFNGSRTPFSFPLVPAMCLWKQGDRVRLFPDSFVAERIA